MQWRSIAFVDLFCWIYSNRIYYLIFLLLIVVIYYEIRLRTVRRPNIPKLPRITLDQHQEQVKRNTEIEVTKL